MKNTLKRTFAALAATALTASMASMTAYAEAMSNYCDKQDNQEAAYDGSYWVQPKTWGETKIDPSTYTGDAKITIDKIELTVDEAKANPTQIVAIKGTGIQDKISTIGFHVLYDTRLTINKQGRKYADIGDALKDFTNEEVYIEPGLLNEVAAAGGDYTYNGTIFTFSFTVPSDVKGGEVFPVGIRYQYDGTTGDLLYNANQNAEGKLQMAYLFTQGIENGYIKITPPVTTTSTTTTTTTTSTTTTSTTTTTGSDTTPTTTSTTVSGSTKAGSTTTKKAAGKTTTTTKASDAPKTGVAGVGVAAAGLAIAVGTAFALRKKNED